MTTPHPPPPAGLDALLRAPVRDRPAAVALQRRLLRWRAEAPDAMEAALEAAVASGEASAEARLFLAEHLRRARRFAAAARHLRALHAATGRPALRRAWLRCLLPDPAALAQAIATADPAREAAALGGLEAASLSAQLAVARAGLEGTAPEEAPLAAFRAALAAFRAAPPDPPPATPEAARNAAVLDRAIAMLRAAGSIALVASGPSLAGGRRGAAIDAHGCVIRINLPKLDAHAEAVGRRTDLVGFSEAAIQPPGLPALRAALLARPELPHILVSGSIAEAPCLPPGALAALDGMADRVALLAPRWRRGLKAICYEVPTSGTATLVWVLLLLGLGCTAHGLDLYRGADHRHFFDAGREPWLGHETDYERWFVHVFLPRATEGLSFGTPSLY